MKKLVVLLLCIMTVLMSSCNTPSEQMAEEDIRKQIVADNAMVSTADNAAGGTWLERYLNISNAEMAECFRTDDMSEGFDICFSRWGSGQREYIVSEVVYPDGVRYLCDLYELTGETKKRTLSYAYDRIKSDERFEDGMKGIGDNAYSEGVKEVNITSEIPQAANNTLLVNESIREGKLLYGTPSDGSHVTIKVFATVEANGIKKYIMCNDERPASDTGKGEHLRNKSYFIGYSENTGNFALVDRQYNETVLCEKVDTADETRRIPEVYGTWGDRYGIYTVSDNKGVVQVGILDADTKRHTVLDTSGVPVGMYGDRLYLSNTKEDGSCAVAYILLGDPQGDAVVFDGPDGVMENVAFSSDGRMAVVYAPADGQTRVAVFNATDGSLIREEYISGVYCDPKYVGFIEDGSVMVLCDEKLLCDEYLFIIGEEE